MSAPPRQPEEASEGAVPRLAVVLSIALHLALTAVVILSTSRWLTTELVAAGPGEGGEGGGGAVEVGVADASAILGFARPQPISNLGDRAGAINNANVEHAPKVEATDDVVPRTEKDPLDPKSLKTDRPVVNQAERVFTGKEERGQSDSTSAQVGRTYGSPTPATVGGVAIGSGSGGGTGLPGGSEYGRRIQLILSRNYNPPPGDGAAAQTVVITLRISRDGQILNVINGRVEPGSIRQRAQLDPVNRAAERAILASNPLPPFPPGFLPGRGEASVNLIFRYPK